MSVSRPKSRGKSSALKSSVSKSPASKPTSSGRRRRSTPPVGMEQISLVNSPAMTLLLPCGAEMFGAAGCNKSFFLPLPTTNFDFRRVLLENGWLPASPRRLDRNHVLMSAVCEECARRIFGHACVDHAFRMMSWEVN